MSAEIEQLKQMDGFLVCANVSGRKRLGMLGVSTIPNADGEDQNTFYFFDFWQNKQELLMPVGNIQSTQEIAHNFGSWRLFHKSQPDFSAWSDHIQLEQVATPMCTARAYLCCTGQIQLPDSESLVQQTLDSKTEGKPLGFDMSNVLAKAWLNWSFQEDEKSRSFSRGRKINTTIF